MSKTDFERYVSWLEDGPNTAGLETTRWAIRHEQENPTAALRLRQAHEQAKREVDAVMLYESTLEHVREAAALLAEDSAEAARLAERLSVAGSLREFDYYLALSMLSKAVVDQDRRIAELEGRIGS
jgi:hypothetical protein